MNKLIKLPIFLGVVGCLCGGVLSLTNFFTADKIKKGEEERANAAYIAHFANLAHRKEIEITNTDLTKAGVVLKSYAYDNSNAYIGTIYTVSATGYAGKANPIKFTISFSDGKPQHYVELSHSESNVGAEFLNWLKGDTNGDRLSNLETGKSGSSVTFKAVDTAVKVCLNDYLQEYTSIPSYTE